MPGRTSRPWRATSSSAGSRMRSSRRLANAAFAGPGRSWRTASAGPAAGRGAVTANAGPESRYSAVSLRGDARGDFGRDQLHLPRLLAERPEVDAPATRLRVA